MKSNMSILDIDWDMLLIISYVFWICIIARAAGVKKVFPRLAIIVVSLHSALFYFLYEGTECPGTNIKREISSLTGDLEPKFWTWRCSHSYLRTISIEYIACALIEAANIMREREIAEKKQELLNSVEEKV